jgi:hypothetical protein
MSGHDVVPYLIAAVMGLFVFVWVLGMLTGWKS